MRALILDISFWQDNPDTSRKVNFKRMEEAGVNGVIFRIGQATWKDKKFEEYWKNSMTSSLLRGGYWYYDNAINPSRQARLCSDILQSMSCKFELPLWADFEDRRNLEFGGWENWYIFLEELKRLLPKYKLGIYSNYYYWNEYKPKGKDSKKESYFSSYPFWIAQYPYDSHKKESEYGNPTIPDNWSNWEFWQVSDRGDGDYYGVESSRVDVNYYNGTANDLYKKYGFPTNNKDIKLTKKLTIDYEESKRIEFKEI